MTAPLIPDTIFKLFQNELTNVNLIFLEKVCKLYNLNLEEAKAKLSKELKLSFEISDVKMKIVKPQKLPNDEERCMARIFRKKDLEVLQCTRRKGKECEFCKRHQKMHVEGRLKYGSIDEPVPKEISPETLKTKKKKSLM